MNALRQYIDLFRSNAAMIDAGSAEPLNALRPEAARRLENSALPPKGSENYENIDLGALLAPDYGLNLARVPLDVNPAASFKCGVPNMSTSLFMLLNDAYAESHTARNVLPEGVVVGSLRSLAKSHPEIVGKYYGRIASPDNPLVNLNTLLAQDGFMLYVPDNVVVEKPLQLVDILQSAMPLMAARRLLIVLGDNASAKLLVCDHTQNPQVEMMSLQCVEVSVGRNSSFEMYDLEESTPMTRRLSTLYLRQEADSRVVIAAMTLYNGITRNEFHCDFMGEGASLRLLGMAIEDESRVADTYSIVNHRQPRCHTDELFKYVMEDCSTGSFCGMVKVFEGAVKTEAYQANRNIVGSDDARMFSKPQLEIYNDDVKCSHGSATGRLDASQLFYLRARGIPEKEAKLLLKQAFMADVIDAVKLDSLKERLRALVERRFAGAPFACASCEGGC